MCFEYDGYNDFTVVTTRKARKEHKCYECSKKIEKGEKYQYCSLKYDGEVQSFKTCLSCEELRNKIIEIERSHGCDMSEAVPPFGELRYCKNNYPELKELF